MSIENARPGPMGLKTILIPNWMHKCLVAVIYLAAIGTVLALHRAVYFESWTDENVHLYVAQRVAEGSVLYRDIHSARPPLALAPLVVLLKLGFTPLFAARAAIVLALLSIAFAVRWGGGRFLGRAAGVAAFAVVLLAPEVSARIAYTGIHFVALWSTLCALLALLNWPLVAGVAGGIALATGQHALVIVAACALVLVMRRPREFIRFIAGLGLTLAATFAVFTAQGGSVWQDLVAHHLYHVTTAAAKESSGDIGWYLQTVGLDNLPLFFLAATSVILSRRGRASFSALLSDPRWTLAFLVIAHVSVVAAMRGALVLYLFPAVPLVALLAADGLVAAARWTWSPAEGGDHSLRVRLSRGISLLAAFLVLTLGGWGLSKVRYEQRDNEAYPFIPHLRFIAMTKVQRLTVVDSIAADFASQLGEGQTIFGFPTIAAAVALRSHRRIAGELADLAPRWIRMGLVERHEIVNTIESDKVGVFITPKLFFLNDRFFRSYLARCYQKPQRFPRATGQGHGIPDIYVFPHRTGINCRANVPRK